MHKKRGFLKKTFVFIALLLGIITAIGQPVNDDFANAIDITHLINDCSANKAYTNTGATMDKNYASSWTSTNNGRNVWFKFIAPATGQIYVELKTGNSSPYGNIRKAEMALWDNTGTTELISTKWYETYSGIEMSYIGLTPGETYYISVNNYDGASYAGTFTLCFKDKVSYDFFEGAKDITYLMNSCSANKEFSNLQATMDKNYASSWTSTNNGRNVWFKFIAPATGQIYVELKTGNSSPYGNIRKAEMALWDNTGITELISTKWYESYSGIEMSYIGLTPGETYYISVNNYEGASNAGSFTLCLEDKVNYDYFEGAKDIM